MTIRSGNQEHRSIKESQIAIDALCHWIPQKSAVGYQRSILEHFFLGIRIPVEEKMVQAHKDHLEHGPRRQDPSAGQEDIPFKRHQTRFEDIAGNDHIDADVCETAFPRFIHDILFPQEKPCQEQQEQGKLQISQAQDIHVTAS